MVLVLLLVFEFLIEHTIITLSRTISIIFEKICARDPIPQQIGLLGGAMREHLHRAHFAGLGSRAQNPTLLLILLLNDFLLFFKEIFEVTCDTHHSTVESVDAGLDGAFVRRSCLFGEVLRGSGDFFGVDLDFSQFVFYLNAQMTDVVFS